MLRVFIYLVLTSTRYCGGSKKDRRNATLTGERHKNVAVSRQDTIMHGDGNVFSCLADMERYFRALRSMLPEHLWKIMFSIGRLNDGRAASDDGDDDGA
jgi:hypothetical protein